MSASNDQLIILLQEIDLRLQNLERRVNQLEGKNESFSEIGETTLADIPPLPEFTQKKQQPIQSSLLIAKGITFFTEGNPLNKIGAITLTICMALGFKHAVDNELIGPTGRVLIGIILGLILLAFGERFYKKEWMQIASGFLGAGEAALFISIYAAQQMYCLIPITLSFPLYLFVLAVVVMQSLRYNLQAIAVLGLFGAFAVPILSSTGSNNFVSLSCYLFLLNCGIYWMVLKKEWSTLKWMAFTFTEIYLFVWSGKIPSDFHYSLSLSWFIPFLALFFTLFTLISTHRTLIKKVVFDLSDVYMVVTNGVVAFGMLYTLLNNDHRPFLGLAAITVAAAFFFLCDRLIQNKLLDPKAFQTFLGVGAWYLFSSIPMICSGYAITIAWSFTAILITLVAVYKRMPTLYPHIFLVMLIALFRLVFIDKALLFFLYYTADTNKSLIDILFFDPKNYTIFSVCLALAVISHFSKSFEKWSLHSDKLYLGTIGLTCLFLYNIICSGLFFAFGFLFYEKNLIWAFLCLQLILIAYHLEVSNEIRFKKILIILSGLFLCYVINTGIVSYNMMHTYKDSQELIASYRILSHLFTVIYILIIYYGVSLFQNIKDLFNDPKESRYLQYFFIITLLIITSMSIKRELFLIVFYNITWNVPFYEKTSLYEMTVSLFYALLTFFLYWYAIKKEDKQMIKLVYGLYALTGIKIYFHDLSRSAQIYRVLSLFVFGVLLLSSSYLAKKLEHKKE